jgi:hypothetical protein
MPKARGWIGRAFGEGDHDRPCRLRFQPPAVIEQALRQDRASELDSDDFPHVPSMAGRFAGALFRPSRICGFLCSFRAGPGGKVGHRCDSVPLLTTNL